MHPWALPAAALPAAAQQHPGVVNTIDSSGYMLSLDVGVLKKISMQDAPGRLRSTAAKLHALSRLGNLSVGVGK